MSSGTAAPATSPVTGRWVRRGRRMSLGAHLREFRRRSALSAGGVLLGTAVGWLLYPWTWAALAAPVGAVAAASTGEDVARVALNFANVTGAFDVQFQVSLTVGIVVSSPVWLFQIFAFLVPGLTRGEARYVFGFLFSAVPLFLGGCIAGWFVLPRIVEVMATFVPPGSTTFYESKTYLDFVLKLVLATGVAFVLPVFVVLLNFMGVLSARALVRGWRWVALGITLFTALATPAADILSMLLLAVPMVVLYLMAVTIALLRDRWSARRRAEV